DRISIARPARRRRGSAPLARQRPFDGALRRRAADDDVLAAADLAAVTEIDAFGDAELVFGGAHPPARSARQAQKGRLPVLGERHLDLRVEVEADRERMGAAATAPRLAPRPAPGDELVFAAQVVTGRGEEQAP